MIARHGKSCDRKGLAQVLMTLVPLALLWWVAVRWASAAPWLAVAAVLLIVFFTLRCFALMHECGHASLFASRSLNRRAGFILGVVAGMPQYVWAQNHNFHHATNGNWERYRGPYTTLSVDEYAALSAPQQRLYRFKCSLAAAPLAGFIYLVFNPRVNWIRGSIAFLRHVLAAKLAAWHVPLRTHATAFRSRYWRNPREYWHMFWNNVTVLCIWALMCWAIGGGLFFSIYLLSISFAGGIGIVLFTVQHNFEHSYASETAAWDYDTGALEGTSYLVLPAWLNWFTANIGYHHIHHLSTAIPGYGLARCHSEYQHLFARVTRVKLSQVRHSLTCILWDTRMRRIITFAEYQQRSGAAQAAG